MKCKGAKCEEREKRKSKERIKLKRERGSERVSLHATRVCLIFVFGRVILFED